MKDYKVKALRYFFDKTESINRFINDEFFVDLERYEFLKSKGAVELVEEQLSVNEEQVQAVVSAIVEEAEETNKTIEDIVDEIVNEIVESEEVEKVVDGIADNMVEEIINKKKRKKSK